MSEKEKIVDKILSQPTYLADSGLYKKVQKALMRMSVSDLMGLETIISMKELQRGQK